MSKITFSKSALKDTNQAAETYASLHNATVLNNRANVELARLREALQRAEAHAADCEFDVTTQAQALDSAVSAIVTRMREEGEVTDADMVRSTIGNLAIALSQVGVVQLLGDDDEDAQVETPAAPKVRRPRRRKEEILAEQQAVTQNEPVVSEAPEEIASTSGPEFAGSKLIVTVGSTAKPEVVGALPQDAPVVGDTASEEAGSDFPGDNLTNTTPDEVIESLSQGGDEIPFETATHAPEVSEAEPEAASDVTEPVRQTQRPIGRPVGRPIATPPGRGNLPPIS